jgi:hypothetical protein
MKTFLLALAIALSPPAFGKCLYLPKHSFVLKLERCSKVTVESGGLRTKQGYFLDMEAESIVGALVTGTVERSRYDWEGNSVPESFEEWKDGAYKTVFVLGEAESICRATQGNGLAMRALRPCCDISPQPGHCFLPATIPLVELGDAE